MENGYESKDSVQADDLTWREQEVLLLLAKHRTNREIADELHLAESTVKDYVGKILSKLYVRNRRQAVERAKELGLLEAEKRIDTKPRTNLPAETTPFIGRRDELAEIKRQFEGIRLLTLVGPGGIGKTRIALKFAEGATADFSDGTFFVSLAPISSVDHLIQTIAEALKFPLATHENPQHQLLRYLQKRQLLLVMDNFEHLLEGVDILSEILKAAPGVKILSTSRERLKLHTETIIQVGGMDFPFQKDSKDILDYDAATLFSQSASKVLPGFDPSAEELHRIAEICQIVQGMPLAIELAAAWLQILSIDEITKELEKGFDILSTDVRDTPERHRSIRAVFDHSWYLLNPSEKKVFKYLSVFRGGFTRDAAQQVSGATLQELMGLVNKSFLSLDPDSGRLEVHELLRQYAEEHLSKSPDVRASAQEAHAAYYAEFMEQRWQQVKGDRQLLALDEIEVDIENIRSAWRYFLYQGNAQKLWKFIIALWYVYWIRWWNLAGMELFAEAVSVLEEANNKEITAVKALALSMKTYFMAWLGLSEQGYLLAKEGVRTLQQCTHPQALWFAHLGVLVNAYFLHRSAEESEAVEKMITIAGEIDDKWLSAYTLFAASMVAVVNEDFVAAKQYAESELEIDEEIGNVIDSTLPLIVLGHVAFVDNELDTARGYYLRCLNISEEVRFHYAIQMSSKYLGKVILSMGEIGEAEKYLVQSLIITKEIGFVRDLINLYYEFARLWVALEKSEQAVELLSFILQHPASYEYRMLEGRIRDSAKELLTEIEVALPLEAFATAVERGKGLELEEIYSELVEHTRSSN
jgi:predicted ATPase/DNA-binding CsgD family transcriptional regulator